jgi:hypothetical protein
MSAREMYAMVGRTGELYLRESDLTIYVEIKDVRNRFGNIDFQVSPLQGKGEAWVSADRVKPRGMV